MSRECIIQHPPPKSKTTCLGCAANYPVTAPTSRCLGGPAAQIPGLRLRDSPTAHQALQEQLVSNPERHLVHVTRLVAHVHLHQSWGRERDLYSKGKGREIYILCCNDLTMHTSTIKLGLNEAGQVVCYQNTLHHYK